MKKIFFLLISACSVLSSEPFDNDFNHYSGMPIDKIRLMGERCSGTNYISGVLSKNFPNCECSAPRKHFQPWFDLPFFGIEKKAGLTQSQIVLDRVNNASLIVLAVRDPYDWVRSFYSNPWHASKKKMLNKGFLHFISHEWVPSDEDASYIGPDHWNPYDQRRFKNVLELRKYKTMNYLQIGAIAPNFVVVKYEEVAKDPQGFVNYISEHFNLEKSSDFNDVLTYKNENKKNYKSSEYRSFSRKELDFMNKNTDWEIEKLIGYFPEENLDQLNRRK